MRRYSAIVLATLPLLLAPLHFAYAAPALPQAAQQMPEAAIDALVAPHFKADGPGAVVIATRDGKTVFRKAYGLADVALKQAMSIDSPARLGSMTKQFTAVAILMLADDGKLALSDDITRFLPGYPTHGAKITIEHLLSHTSGIPSYTGKRNFVDVMRKDVTVAQGIDFFKDDALEFTPGTQFRYDNSGYFLLGAIIEKASGQPYARFLDERIFKPMGMTHTGYEDARFRPVSGYDSKANKVESISMTWPYAAGALVSTVDDLARWQTALADGKLLRPQTLRQAWTAHPLADGKTGPYGYGWFVGRLNGVDEVFHGGNITGFTSDAVWLPKERVYVAMLANRDADGIDAPLANLTRKIAMQVAGKPLPAPSDTKLDAVTLADYVGVYPIDDKRAHTVRLEHGGLTIQGTGMPRAPLHYYKQDGFLIGDSLVTVQFQRNAGFVTGMTIDDELHHSVHRRAVTTVVDPQTVQVASAVLDQYLGRYSLAPGFVIEITRVGDAMHAGPVGQPAVSMAALAQNLFLDADHDVQLRFEKQADGRMILTFEQGALKLSGQRQL
ncbi:serine hydrolase domain-containing protein [Massilia rhizosphaerae]|uniref:serine hydrolase domain-containing protein n=1 Tax=Massilia rhizosphaerae TaxID=2784389 RepID=UPI0018DDDFAA|nr:serine hydrolase domain-containing protein [Massilia rhizosphaerae]